MFKITTSKVHFGHNVIHFADLLDHVTVLIGIAVNGKAVAGVINQPFYNYKAGPDVRLDNNLCHSMYQYRYSILCTLLSIE